MMSRRQSNILFNIWIHQYIKWAISTRTVFMFAYDLWTNERSKYLDAVDLVSHIDMRCVVFIVETLTTKFHFNWCEFTRAGILCRHSTFFSTFWRFLRYLRTLVLQALFSHFIWNIRFLAFQNAQFFISWINTLVSIICIEYDILMEIAVTCA